MNILKDIIGIELYTLVEVMGLFLFALGGSFLKETYNSYSKKTKSVDIFRIVVSTILAVVLTETVRDLVDFECTKRILLGMAFLLGLLGYELFVRLSSIEGIIGLSRDIRTIIENILGSAIDTIFKHHTKKEENNKDDKGKK